MLKHIFHLFLLLFLLGITSCKSRKDMIYLQNNEDQKVITINPPGLNDYKIKVNDNLYVDIQSLNLEVNALFNPTKSLASSGGTNANYGDAGSQLLNGFQVDIRGAINLPVIGKVSLLNLTLDEAETKIQQHANEYLKDATVKIKLLNYKFTVLGEVKSPGVYYNFNTVFTIFDAISMAQGETEYGQIKKIKLIRSNNNQSRIFYLDFTQNDFMTSEAFYVQPNDVIYIEPDKSKPLKINLPVYTLVLSSISTIVLLLNFVSNN